MFTSNQHVLSGSLRAGQFTVLDSIYATMHSGDQRLLFTANRGMNHITIYDYPTNTMRLRDKMPDLHEYVPSSPGGPAAPGPAAATW